MKTWCLVEHLVSGKVSLAEYDHGRGQLKVDGKPARLGDYWCLCKLARVAQARRPAAALARDLDAHGG
jgi:hypothetical protein